MKEYVEFRLYEAQAKKWFRKDEGKLIGSDKEIRVVKIAFDDPRFVLIGNLSRLNLKRGGATYMPSGIVRDYTVKDIAAADLFALSFRNLCDPAGEEVGTTYDDEQACKVCKAGAPLLSPLRLQLSSIAKNSDIAVTIAGEAVVSQRFKKVMAEAGISGLNFAPVFNGSKTSVPSDGWFQLAGSNFLADVAAPTWIGTYPFSWDENDYACPLGDNLGLCIFSEISVRLDERNFPDIFQTRQYFGDRRGLLRPERRILVSPRFRKTVIDNGLKGMRFAVAHMAV